MTGEGEDCCCPDGSTGKTKLVQLKKVKGKNGESDRWLVDSPSSDIQKGYTSKGGNRVVGYTEDSQNKNRDVIPGGRKNNEGNGYIDAPGLIPSGETSIRPYNRDMRVESYCECSDGDYYQNEAIEFNFKRGAFDSKGKLSKTTRHADPSKYPRP